MRKLIVLFFLAAFTVTVSAQTYYAASPLWKELTQTSAQNAPVKFFSPVPTDLFKTGVKAVNPSVWLLRPMATITAIQLNWNKVTKQFDASALSSAGLGVSYAHFVEANGLPYNNFSVNALLLLGGNIEATEPASMSFAITGSFMNFVSLGGLYNFGNKSFGILTGVAIKF
jgi:hypothetical protein